MCFASVLVDDDLISSGVEFHNLAASTLKLNFAMCSLDVSLNTWLLLSLKDRSISIAIIYYSKALRDTIKVICESFII